MKKACELALDTDATFTELRLDSKSSLRDIPHEFFEADWKDSSVADFGDERGE
jgi:hypothetical protein